MTDSQRKYIPTGMPPAYYRISDKDLDEFIAIYKEEYGEDVSRSEASEMASRLVMLYQLLAKKLPGK